MKIQSQNQQYRHAARTRDALHALQRLLAKQRVVLPNHSAQVDMFGLARQNGIAGIQIMFVRNGRLIGTDFQLLETIKQQHDTKILEAFLTRFYTRPHIILPQEIWIPVPSTKYAVLQQWLLKHHSQIIKITTPQRGPKAKLFQMAQENAAKQLKNRLTKYLTSDELTLSLQKTLKLKYLPEHIEACDVSHLQGLHSTAAVVSWQHNQPLKNLYRSYRIQHHHTTTHNNDTASIFQAILKHAKKKIQLQQPWPQLLLIDGGKAQANAALKALKTLGLNNNKMDVCALAKGRTLKKSLLKQKLHTLTNPIQTEYVVFPQRKSPLRLPAHSPCLLLLQRIRDEAHRFALYQHQKIRSKHTLTSGLLQIPGVGKQRTAQLLKTLGSLKKIQSASPQQLEQVPGFSKKLAHNIYQQFHS